MVGFAISLSGPVALLLAALGSIWIYQDANGRDMDTADMWAVGSSIPPLIGAGLVLAYYLQKRDPEYQQPGMAPEQ